MLFSFSGGGGANRTFIDCGKLKIVVSSVYDGINQPVCYAPEHRLTVGYNDILNT